MSHQVLARKWRPRVFREMVGQEHVLKALINALDHDRLHHAYLFTGTRGVGKTTVARILAKCLNCETGVSSEPCGECSACVEVAEGRCVDLIEVDAASRTKVDDTRELLENVQYRPTQARYKVYIIDEVHMLSAASFNALLKTLEEPPEHVKFLLATTDPQKLPATVLSRCLQFNLKNMPPELIVNHLRDILSKESIAFDEPALWLLARSADGSMRDALSLTDQAVSFGSGKLGESDVRAMLGTVDLSFVHRLARVVAGQDAREMLQLVESMSEHAPNYAGSLQELASLLHRVAVAQAVPDAVDNSWGDADEVRELAAMMTAEDAQLYYEFAVAGRRDLGLAPDARSGFEMCLLRMIAFRAPVAIDDETRATGGEGGDGGEGAGATAASPPPAPEPVQAVTEVAPPVKKPEPRDDGEAPAGDPSADASGRDNAEPAPATAPESEPATVTQAQASPASERGCPEPGRWAELLDALDLRGMIYSVASHCEMRQVDGDRVYFTLDETNAALYNDACAERIGAALAAHFDRPFTAHIEVGSPRYETPAGRARRLLEERREAAVASIEADPKVKLLIERFDGKLDHDSITPIKH